ncbi:MAG: PilZ domain-containing protein [Candidatus Omnitrophota bacterium]
MDKRKFPRVVARFIVTCNMDRSLEMHMWIGNREIDALMLNLSQEGMAILTQYNVRAGSVISIKFTLINLGTIVDEDRVRSMEMVGKVCYNTLAQGREYRLGISFVRISRKDKEAIANFVRSEIK